jgi:hypothetical protein
MGMWELETGNRMIKEAYRGPMPAISIRYLSYYNNLTHSKPISILIVLQTPSLIALTYSC